MAVSTVRIICKNIKEPNKQEHMFPIGTTLSEIYDTLDLQLHYPVVAARVNNKAKDLNYVIYRPKTIEFIDMTSPSGYRAYIHSLCMVMAKAIYELFPEASLHFEHPINKGYYCTINGRENSISETTVERIKERMKALIASDLPIITEELPTEEVIELFKSQNHHDKVRLLETLGNAYTRYFRLDDYCDYYSGILVPSTGYISLFGLCVYEKGILLQVPMRNNPLRIPPFEDQPKMFDVFDEFLRWNELMGLRTVGDFNRLAGTDQVYNLIKVSEALHEKKISQIADMIFSRPQSKFIMISGPSSSGKTTFSKRLSVQLMVCGLKPLILSMDNYFVNREDTPLDEDGEWDFESLHAVDLDLFNLHLEALFRGETIELPYFNFEDGKRYFRGEMMHMNPENVLVIEGIHALNPALTKNIPEEAMFKIYVSALTSISLDNHNWISTTDTRLIRRIVRDSKFRNYSAQDTIGRWPSVRRGEEQWIFPYQEKADVMFNSSLIFELAVLRKHAETPLEVVPENCEEYTEAHRLMMFLKYFNPIYDYEIPPTSLLREFVGGSSFAY